MLMIRRLLNKNFEEDIEHRQYEGSLQRTFEGRSFKNDVDMEDDWNNRNMTLRERIHLTLLHNRLADESIDSDGFESNLSTAVYTTDGSREDSGRRLSYDRKSERSSNYSDKQSTSRFGDNDDQVNKYLTEQNKKFNELINKNLDYVPHPSLDLYDVYKHTNAVDGANGQKQKLSDFQINELIDTIDDESRIKLYQRLSHEVNNENVVENLTNFEKLEILIILIVKINFLLVRYSIPITKKMYLKFMENQMLVFNHNNFNRMLNYLIKVLNNVDKHSKFNHHFDDNNEFNEQFVDEVDSEEDDKAGLINKVLGVIPQKNRIFGLLGGFNYVGSELVSNIMGKTGNQLDELTLLSVAEEFAKQLQ